nr:alanine racemase [Conyzicola lurida]
MREARIDLGAISRNVETIRAAVDGTDVMVVVKANGYGHGAVESARAALAGGAVSLGVVEIEEALALRAAGIDAPVLSWLHGSGADFDAATSAGIELGVNNLDQLERIAAASGVSVVHLKVDSGLGRNGANPAECAELFEAAVRHERAGRLQVRGFFSHLANAGEAADAAQVARFTALLDEARAAGLEPEVVHLAATAAALRVPESRFSLVRVGVGAYGLSPFDDATSADLGLTPAMSLSAEIISVKRVPVGSGVSYGHDYVTARETTLALVPIGYADGIPRHASGAGPVSINGQRFSLSGRVAMDQFVVDVGDTPVAVGDRAVLFGDPATGAPSATDWADAAGTINYEVVTRIGNRVVREYS